VFSAVGIATFAVNGRLVVQIRRARGNKRSCWLFIGRMIRVKMNINRASLTLLAGPTVYVVLVGFERDAVNYPGYRTCVRILGGCRVPGQRRKKQARDERRQQTCPRQLRYNSKH
jgi:hypothetical protein